MSTKIKTPQLIAILAFSFYATGVFAQAADKATPSASETEIQEAAPEANQDSNQDVVKIDEDELPGESVIPKTDTLQSIVNKNIKFSKRFMLDVETGSVLDEPIVNAYYFLARASYFVNEDYSFGIGLRSRFGDRTDYSQQLFQGTAQLEFNRAPAPTESHFLSFGYNFYYGKLSLSKNLVIPATTKLDADAGLQHVGSSDKPFVQAALSQSFFMTKHLAIGLSYGISLAQSIDPTSVNIRSSQPNPQEADFSQKMQFNQYLSANLSILF